MLVSSLKNAQLCKSDFLEIDLGALLDDEIFVFVAACVCVSVNS